jgi:hypothetical protein
MPWPTGESFASAHNKKLKGAAAATAAKQATAMVNEGVPEGEAIATANKTGDREMKKKKRRSPLYDHPRSPH